MHNLPTDLDKLRDQLLRAVARGLLSWAICWVVLRHVRREVAP
jgi:hypothetical protein